MKIRIGRAGVEGSRGLALSWVPRRVEALSWVDGADPTVEGSRYLVTIERGGARLVREVGEAALSMRPPANWPRSAPARLSST